MSKKKFERLVNTHLLTEEELNGIITAAVASKRYPEELLLEKGIPKHDILFCLSGYYDCPFVEYDENLTAPHLMIMRLKLDRQKQALWFPLSVSDNTAEVVAYDPHNPQVIAEIKKTLKVGKIFFRVALPADIVRIVENNLDVNPGFPFAGGRSPLALVRVFFACRRSAFAHSRTSFAKGRTGLAFVRTGLAFIAISLTLLRVLGAGYWAVLEAPFVLIGLAMILDGTRWYMPSRDVGRKPIDCSSTEATGGTSVLAVTLADDDAVFERSGIVGGAAGMRAGWDELSPIMRRRFLSCDRADFAEERASLAGFRTILAKARTGLAFTRTGIAFAGMGIALIRHFPTSAWTPFDLALIAIGVVISAEGFFWYFGGRRAGRESLRAIRRKARKENIWDVTLPFHHQGPGIPKDRPRPQVEPWHLPGIWATTGLALERTLLAERRSVMARLRNVMAHARTGLAFIRTGISIAAVGAGLMVFFGISQGGWTLFDGTLIVIGLALIADGFHWTLPMERIRAAYPYCYGDVEIPIPEYAKPAYRWQRAVFSHDNN